MGPSNLESAPLVKKQSAYIRSVEQTLGILRIQAKAARELPPEGVLGRLDPFVKMSCGTKQMLKCKALDRGGISPVFPNPETFQIILAGEETKMLKIEVFDQRIVGDHKLAEAFVPIRQIILDHQGPSTWLDLKHAGTSEHKAQSKIELSVTYLPPLYVTVSRLEGLPLTTCCGNQNPYVRLRWDREPYKDYKRTPTCAGGNSKAEWHDENQFIYNTPTLHHPSPATLTLEVVHEGAMLDNEICTSKLPITKIEEDARRGMSNDYPLLTATGGVAGTVTLLFEIQ